MKRLFLVLLLAFGIEHAPFRLMTTAALAFVTPPGFTRLSDGISRYWDARELELRLQKLGWTVSYESGLMQRNLYGVTYDKDRRILVDASLPWNARLAVLAHEAGHTFQPPVLTIGQGEVFAESVALLVARDGYREHARYLSLWRADLWTAVVYWRDIYRAASMLKP